MKKLLSLLFAVLMITSSVTVVTAAKTGFSDVADSRWSASAIVYAVTKGYMNGVGNGKFDPTGALTRGMVATVLWRREGSPAPTAPSGFVDVPAGAWYADAVAWAKETGVVNGMTETTFAPNGFITREQLATMLFRFSSSAPVSVPERADLSPFADDEKTSAWAKESLEWAVEAGLINGTDGNHLAPGGNATREQFAAIIERYDESFKLTYATPVIRSHYTEKEYPLVTDADFYVATDGDDGADGSLAHPFRTWERARDAVRAVDKTGRDNVTVAFKAGDYGAISVPLSPEDSGTPGCPVVYCKYGDGDVVFNNGIDLNADDFSDLSEEEKTHFPAKFADKIKRADVSAVIDSGIAARDVVMYYDGGLCVEARYPNTYEDGSDHLLTAAEYNDKESLRIVSPLLTKRLAAYDDLSFSTMETYGYIIRGYRKDSFIVGGYDPATGVLSIANWETSEFGVMRDWRGVDGMGLQLCITNVPAELDFTHEYWVDPSSKALYVYAPEGSYHIPVLGDMVTMDGTNDVTFRGLTFKNTSGSFIKGELCHGITLELCTFSGVSSTKGVSFNDCSLERAMDITVNECDFSLAYGYSLYINGGCSGQYRFSKRSNVLIDNNQVTTSNLVFDDECAVYVPNCCGLTVSHNRFANTSRGAIAFNHSYDVMIEYNEFTGIMQNSEDGGAVYSHSSADGWNVTVRRNFFDYMPSEGTGTFGYYVDDNSCGVEICENLFYDAASPVMIHLGRDNTVHDNVFIHGGVGLSVGQRYEIDELGLEGAGKSGGEFRKTRSCWTKIFDLIETYPEYRAGIEKWCPEVLKYHLDYTRMNDRYFVMNPVNTVRDNVYINSSGNADTTMNKYELEYVSDTGGRGYTFEQNPMFVNPTKGDYRVLNTEEFPNIDFERIGRY
ncbi:MAG: S-layer homology domain-containing protein [Clostridia bacterium]|nr:S-layer homology domain-containing protein [Clostridia bacterium]MBR7032380.1 S-layer homology domain-containing protein [Clostridia bacterium]